MAYKVILDASHGGYDAGANYNGRLEKQDNLDLMLAVGEILADNGLDVYYTRVDDTYISPLSRVQMANAEDADLFVSINRGASQKPNNASGVKTLVNNTNVAQDIAKEVNDELENVGFKNLGIEERTDLAILRRAQMPAVIIEVGYHNSDVDNKLLDERFTDVSYAIAAGILDGFDMATSDKPEVNYRVQVGLFRILANAIDLEYNLSQLGYDVIVKPQGEYYAVLVGALPTIEEAKELEEELKLTGYSTLIVSENN